MVGLLQLLSKKAAPVMLAVRRIRVTTPPVAETDGRTWLSVVPRR